MVKSKISTEKREGNERRINNMDFKQSWNVVKSILGIEDRKQPCEIVNDNNEVTSDPSEVANILNDYFIEKTEIIRSNRSTNVDPTEGISSQIGNKLDTTDMFELKLITRSNLRNLIKKGKGGKASG